MSTACASVIGMYVHRCTVTLPILNVFGCRTSGSFMGALRGLAVVGMASISTAAGRPPRSHPAVVSSRCSDAWECVIRLRNGGQRPGFGAAAGNGCRASFWGWTVGLAHALFVARLQLVTQQVCP